MNPASKDIADFLAHADSGLGYILGTDLFYSRMPDTPNVCVTCFDNPGNGPLLTFEKSTSSYFFSSISVRVRDVDYSAGWTKMFNIVTYLHGLSHLNAVDNSAYYGLVKAMNDPQVLYWDKNDRVVFFTNFDIQRKPI